MLMSRPSIWRPTVLTFVLWAFAFWAGPVRADAYRFDPDHTVASFRCGPFGFGAQSGHVKGAHGTMIFDPAHPGDSVVDVTLDMSTLHTDWHSFDSQARGPDFLDVDRFPTASFKSRRVEVTGDGTAEVTGDLTLHGVTREVVMTVAVRRSADHHDSLGFSARARIHRSDFGVDGRTPLLSDTIDLRINAEAQPGS